MLRRGNFNFGVLGVEDDLGCGGELLGRVLAGGCLAGARRGLVIVVVGEAEAGGEQQEAEHQPLGVGEPEPLLQLAGLLLELAGAALQRVRPLVQRRQLRVALQNLLHVGPRAARHTVSRVCKVSRSGMSCYMSQKIVSLSNVRCNLYLITFQHLSFRKL